MNKFFPVLSLIHRSTGCFCRKIRNHQFYNNISITRKKFLFGSIFGFAFCLDLFGSIFGFAFCVDLVLGLDLFGSVWIYIGFAFCLDLFESLFGSIFGFAFCSDLYLGFHSVWICLHSVLICFDLFGSV